MHPHTHSHMHLDISNTHACMHACTHSHTHAYTHAACTHTRKHTSTQYEHTPLNLWKECTWDAKPRPEDFPPPFEPDKRWCIPLILQLVNPSSTGYMHRNFVFSWCCSLEQVQLFKKSGFLPTVCTYGRVFFLFFFSYLAMVVINTFHYGNINDKGNLSNA